MLRNTYVIYKCRCKCKFLLYVYGYRLWEGGSPKRIQVVCKLISKISWLQIVRNELLLWIYKLCIILFCKKLII